MQGNKSVGADSGPAAGQGWVTLSESYAHKACSQEDECCPSNSSKHNPNGVQSVGQLHLTRDNQCWSERVQLENNGEDFEYFLEKEKNRDKDEHKYATRCVNSEYSKLYDNPILLPMVSVLFADVVGFTSLVESMHPCHAAAMLHSLFSRFDALANLHGVQRVDIIGDAYFAATNLDGDQSSDHAARLARFALDAVRVASETAVECGREDGARVQVRVGLHCGPAASAWLGKRTLIGDTVNTASRMESTGRAGCVQCTPAMAALIAQQDPSMSLSWRGLVDLKGKGTMATYWVMAGPARPCERDVANAPTSQVETAPPSRECDGAAAPVAANVAQPSPCCEAMSAAAAAAAHVSVDEPHRLPDHDQPASAEACLAGHPADAPASAASAGPAWRHRRLSNDPLPRTAAPPASPECPPPLCVGRDGPRSRLLGGRPASAAASLLGEQGSPSPPASPGGCGPAPGGPPLAWCEPARAEGAGRRRTAGPRGADGCDAAAPPQRCSGGAARVDGPSGGGGGGGGMLTRSQSS